MNRHYSSFCSEGKLNLVTSLTLDIQLITLQLIVSFMMFSLRRFDQQKGVLRVGVKDVGQIILIELFPCQYSKVTFHKMHIHWLYDFLYC